MVIKQRFAEQGQEVTAIVIEPVMAEGGDCQVSGRFANGIRNLTKRLGIHMIVDEVQSGCVTSGTYWAHEQWELDSPPDFVTFAKKMQASGCYHSEETKMVTPMRHHNTWMGDPIRAMLAANQNKLIKRDGLIDLAKETGEYLYNGLTEISHEHPRWV